MAKNILIADDNSIVREVLKDCLKQTAEIETTEAANGREAIEKARENRPDLIILDLAMPVMNGAQAAKILKQFLPEVPIVLFTMFNVGSDWARDIGVDAVVSKPDGIAQLARCVEAFLGPGQAEGARRINPV
jgi:two-component system chemotaxis response regulator CheY